MAITNKSRRELINKWINRLTSKKFKQARNAYVVENTDTNEVKFCALSVLYESLPQTEKVRECNYDGESTIAYEYRLKSKPELYGYDIDEYVSERLGCEEEFLNEVINWNDKNKYSFYQIAQKIKAYFKKKGIL